MLIFFLMLGAVFTIRDIYNERKMIRDNIIKKKNEAKKLFSNMTDSESNLEKNKCLIFLTYVLKKKFFIPQLIKSFVILFFALYLIAFAMKDRANNEFGRNICKEFVNGPRNVIAIIVNKVGKSGTMKYKSRVGK